MELLTQWYCPNPDLELKVQSDVQVGGEYVVEMGQHVVRGTYLEVEPPYRLAFSWNRLGWEPELDRLAGLLSAQQVR
ncbi:SRPBCC domain-containing protein [Kribbella sp. NPDC050820]|uniref:SRPBCC family protein n=1 Tax=Kribbella sp. NPDC050820 TaxID=3155408 RepID=UPI0033C5702F